VELNFLLTYLIEYNAICGFFCLHHSNTELGAVKPCYGQFSFELTTETCNRNWRVSNGWRQTVAHHQIWDKYSVWCVDCNEWNEFVMTRSQ